MAKIRLNYRRLPQYCYYISTILITIRSTIGLSKLDSDEFSIITYLAYALLLVKLFVTKYSTREIGSLLALEICSILIWYVSKNTIFIFSILFIFGAKNMDVVKVLRNVSITLFASVVYVITMSFCGVVSFIDEKGVGFGFSNPNGFQGFISAASIYYLGFRLKKLRLGDIILVFLLNIVTSLFTGSRTGIVLIAVETLICFMFKSPKRVSLIQKIKYEKIYLVMVVLVLGCVLFYSNNIFMRTLNSILSGRLVQAHEYFQKYSLHMFGSHIIELDAGYEYWHILLDCGYARLFINFGFIAGIVFVVAHYKAIKRARICGDGFTLVILLGFAVMLISENGGLNCNFNMSLIILSKLIFNRGSKQEVKQIE